MFFSTQPIRETINNKNKNSESSKKREIKTLSFDELARFDAQAEPKLKRKAQSSRSKSKRRPGKNIRNQFLDYQIIHVAGDGDCGFTSLGISRKDAAERLLSNLERITALVGPLVSELLLTEHFHTYLSHNGISVPTIEDGSCAQETPAVVKAAIVFDLVLMQANNGWAHPCVLQAIAEVQGFRLKIWRLGATKQLIPHRGPEYDFSDYCPAGWQRGQQVTEIVYRNNNHFDRIERTTRPLLQSIEESVPINKCSVTSQLIFFLIQLSKRIDYCLALDVIYRSTDWQEGQDDYQHKKISKFKVSKQWLEVYAEYGVTHVNIDRLPRIGQYDCLLSIAKKLFSRLTQVKRTQAASILSRLNESSPCYRTLNKLYQQQYSTCEEEILTAGAIIAPTGYGKTYTYLFTLLSSLNNQKTQAVVLVPNQNLLIQTKNALIEHFNFPEHKIAIIQGRKSTIEQHQQVVLTTYQSFATSWFNKKIDVNKVGIVIGDEAHNSLSEKRTDSLEAFKKSALYFGLTATPNTLSSRLESKLPVLFKRDLMIAINEAALCPLIAIQVRPKCSGLVGEQASSSREQPIEALLDLKQNDLFALIADIYINQLSPVNGQPYHGQQALIFCRTQKQADEVADYLTKTLKPHFDTIPCLRDKGVAYSIHSETKNSQELIDAHINNQYIFAVTVNKLREGYDNHTASLCFNLSGTCSEKNYLQGVGRVARRNPKDLGKIAVVFDFIYTLKHLQLISIPQVYGTWAAGVGAELKEAVKANLTRIQQGRQFEIDNLVPYELAAEDEVYAYDEQGEKVLVTEMMQQQYFNEQILPNQQAINELSTWLDNQIVQLKEQMNQVSREGVLQHSSMLQKNMLNSFEKLSKSLKRLTAVSTEEGIDNEFVNPEIKEKENSLQLAWLEKSFLSILNNLNHLDKPNQKAKAKEKRKYQSTARNGRKVFYTDIPTLLALIRSKAERKIKLILKGKKLALDRVVTKQFIGDQEDLEKVLAKCGDSCVDKLQELLQLSLTHEIEPSLLEHLFTSINDLISSSLNQKLSPFNINRILVSILSCAYPEGKKLKWIRLLLILTDDKEMRSLIYSSMYYLDIMEIPAGFADEMCESGCQLQKWSWKLGIMPLLHCWEKVKKHGDPQECYQFLVEFLFSYRHDFDSRAMNLISDVLVYVNPNDITSNQDIIMKFLRIGLTDELFIKLLREFDLSFLIDVFRSKSHNKYPMVLELYCNEAEITYITKLARSLLRVISERVANLSLNKSIVNLMGAFNLIYRKRKDLILADVASQNYIFQMRQLFSVNRIYPHLYRRTSDFSLFYKNLGFAIDEYCDPSKSFFHNLKGYITCCSNFQNTTEIKNYLLELMPQVDFLKYSKELALLLLAEGSLGHKKFADITKALSKVIDTQILTQELNELYLLDKLDFKRNRRSLYRFKFLITNGLLISLDSRFDISQLTDSVRDFLTRCHFDNTKPFSLSAAQLSECNTSIKKDYTRPDVPPTQSKYQWSTVTNNSLLNASVNECDEANKASAQAAGSAPMPGKFNPPCTTMEDDLHQFTATDSSCFFKPSPTLQSDDAFGGNEYKEWYATWTEFFSDEEYKMSLNLSDDEPQSFWNCQG